MKNQTNHNQMVLPPITCFSQLGKKKSSSVHAYHYRKGYLKSIEILLKWSFLRERSADRMWKLVPTKFGGTRRNWQMQPPVHARVEASPQLIPCKRSDSPKMLHWWVKNTFKPMSGFTEKQNRQRHPLCWGRGHAMITCGAKTRQLTPSLLLRIWEKDFRDLKLH